MKAILVIDMPKSCEECPFYDTRLIKSCWADMDFIARTTVYNEKIIQPFCPLKPMPKRMLTLAKINNGEILNNNEIQYMKGRNDCIDEILGEVDNE